MFRILGLEGHKELSIFQESLDHLGITFSTFRFCLSRHETQKSRFCISSSKILDNDIVIKTPFCANFIAVLCTTKSLRYL